MDKENTVRIIGRDLPVSYKHVIEISNYIRHKSILWAKKQLGLVLDKKIAVPFKRFNKDSGHRPGMAAGSYPQNATKEVLNLLKSLEGYAAHNNMDKNNLYIKEIIPNRTSSTYHTGRIRGIHMRSTHLEIVAAEKKQSKKENVKGNKK